MTYLFIINYRYKPWQMGNITCNQCGQGESQHQLIIRIPAEQEKSVSEQQLQVDFTTAIRQRTKSTISSIRIDNLQPIKLNIMSEGGLQTIRIPLKGMTKKCSEFSQQHPRIDIYSVELGTYQENQRKEGPIIQYAIISPDQQSLSVIAFVGEYRSQKKSKGLYLLLRENEAFMFQGVFNGDQNIGTKVILGSSKYQKYWGKFNSKFQLNGPGQQLVFIQHEETGEYYSFSGHFSNGVREGGGILKIREQQKEIYEPRHSRNEKILRLPLINDAQRLLKNRSNEQLVKKLIDLLTSLSGYTPNPPPIFKESDCKLIIQGTWRKGLIQGLTEQKWPLKRYRFYGVYKENERDGYGEEFAYEQRISKGFYKKGRMDTTKDNQFLLLGFKLLNGLWRRNAD